ncbi:hypothetical protein AVEN_116638-1 [Araneus ventricosus]|uniref:Uncharacterized protein n=1 Tax=Araneus ventricosus TaxID=182803 RepID=A0A4Y2FHY4_ARAVE|nr:hypothetical protein AVEN_116638-1 [Araneus ventricosus]
MTSDEIQRVELNHQSEKYGQNTINNLMTVHLGNTTNHFAIGEAEPNQLSDIPSVNTVNYSGSINNDGRMNKLKVKKSQPECITETSEKEIAFPDRIDQRCQKGSTMIISNPGASELITDGLAFVCRSFPLATRCLQFVFAFDRISIRAESQQVFCSDVWSETFHLQSLPKGIYA